MAATRPSASVFRRGGHKAELFGSTPGPQDDFELSQQLQELCQVWSEPKHGKGLAAAIWRPELNVAEVVTTGRKQLYFQGAAASGPKQHTAIHLLDICCGPSLHACLAVH
eukprot:jgi/Chrzof1/89/Cz01g03040.t1